MISLLVSLCGLARVSSYVVVPLYHPLSYFYPPPHVASPLLHSPYIQVAPLAAPDLSYSTLEKG